MTGRIDRQTMQDLATLVMSVINSDLDNVIDATMSLCSAETSLKFDRAFRRDAWSFMARFEQGTIESLDMAGLLEEFFALLRRYRIRCPADLVFLIKALSTIQGVARDIDPSFDLIAHGRPQLEKLIRERYGFRAAQDRIVTAAQRYLSLVEDFRMKSAMCSINSGDGNSVSIFVITDSIDSTTTLLNMQAARSRLA